MPKTVIHVNMHRIRKNAKTGSREPVVTVKRGKVNRYCHTVAILGPSQVVYAPDHPLKCGARCYIVTEAEVVLDPEPQPAPVCSR